MSGSNDGSESWSSKFLKVASAAAAATAVAGGLYAILSSSASANSELEEPFGARRERKEGDDGGPSSYNHGTPPSQIGWQKPKIGWVKLNVDGSRDHEGPSAGCGGVLRDASGMWLRGFAQKLDPSKYEAHETELQAILTGLKLAWEMKAEKVDVESDSEPVVSMVENGLGFKYHRPEYDLVKDIRKLRLDPKWQVRLVRIPRTANRVANRLAKNARTLSSDDLQQYHSPPDKICEQIHLEDIIGSF